LQAGADVRVGGTHQGTVNRIDLPRRSDGQVVVVMDLEQRTRNIVNKGSVASVQSEGLLGDKYVEISFGEKDAPAVKDGDTIRSEPPIDIADLIKKANQILGTADDAMQNVETTTNNLQAVTGKINAGTGTVGALINDRKMYQQASAGVTAFQEDMEALKHNFLLRGFFKQRGFEDTAELAKHRISKLPSGPSLGDFVYDASKIFAKDDSAKLRNQKAMDTAGHFLENNRFGLAVVAASTGDKGDSDKSRLLSEARAMVVREYLVEHFRLDDTRVKTLAIGKTGRPGDKAKVEIIGYRAD
jgi:phospholipid/cholesterol/gamma-HCH transport system substrate-binding protein